MGRQIALNAAHHGFTVRIWDANAGQLQAAERWTDEYIAGRIEKGRWTRDEAAAARAKLSFAADLAEAAADADLAIEAVVEDLAVKRRVFAELDRLCPPRAILVTNSSTFVSSLLADATRRPAQVANLHYFNPAMVMEVVEVVQGPHTSDETAALLVEFAKRVGKRPILMKKEIEGFIANRLLRALGREATFLVEVVGDRVGGAQQAHERTDLSPHEGCSDGDLALEDAEPVRGDGRAEPESRIVDGREDFGLDELAHSLGELIGTRPVLHQPARSRRWSSSNSISAARRPMTASSTLRCCPERWRRA